jgi:hypothetical protein
MGGLLHVKVNRSPPTRARQMNDLLNAPHFKGVGFLRCMRGIYPLERVARACLSWVDGSVCDAARSNKRRSVSTSSARFYQGDIERERKNPSRANLFLQKDWKSINCLGNC